MKSKILINCSNCGSTNFTHTSIGEILATEGHFNVNAYACLKCGHIELFSPALDAYAKQEREKLAQKKQLEEQERKRKEEEWNNRVKELNDIINNEDSTVRQVKEAKAELEKIGAPYGVIRVGGNRFGW